MISKLTKYAKYGKRYVGVEHSSINGNERINGLVLQFKKGELIKEKGLQVNNIKELEIQLAKDQHLFLIINNDQVITKEISGEIEEEQILGQAFPNLDLNQFYLEILRTKSTIYVSICRKEYLNELLVAYKAQHFHVIGFSLGNLVISQLIKFDMPTHFCTSNAKIALQEQEIIAIDRTTISEEEDYQINGLSLTNGLLLSLAGILQYFIGNDLNAQNEQIIQENLKADFNQGRIFKLGLQAALIMLFSSLLISFVFFTNYTQQLNSLSENLSLNKSAKNTVLLLKNEVGKKEKLIENYSSSTSKASYFIDQFAQSIPSSILLDGITYQPLRKKIKEEEKVQIFEGKINIKGILTKPNEFSQWVNSLEELKCVDKITIEDYGVDEMSRSVFKISIQLK